MDQLIKERQMPGVEAVLAGTLALMTGYSQYLQAACDPAHRAGMGEKIAHNLAMLAGHPQLSSDCRCVLWHLHERWAGMAGCTREAGAACHAHEAPAEVFSLPGSRTLQ